jgi:hypothetical protein
MKNQSVIFSTRADKEFFSNDVFSNVPNPPGDVPYTVPTHPLLPVPAERVFNQWTWYMEGSIESMKSASEQAKQRGLVFRFNPYNQMPVSKIQVEAIDLPRFGMQSHFIGRVSMSINNFNATVGYKASTAAASDFISAWPQPNTVKLTCCWDGYDCDSPLEVLNKYKDILLSAHDPSTRDNLIKFVPTSCGSINMVLAPYIQVQFDLFDQGTDESLYKYLYGSYQLAYILPNNVTKFFGQLTNFGFNRKAVQYGLVIPSSYSYLSQDLEVGDESTINSGSQMVNSLGRFTFPFASQVRLNARVVGNKMFNKNVSRNMQDAEATTLIAVFPFSSQKTKSGFGAGISNNMFIKNPSKGPVDIEMLGDFTHIHYMEFWFTQGSSDEPLYIPYTYLTNVTPPNPQNNYPLNGLFSFDYVHDAYDQYGPSVLNVGRGPVIFPAPMRGYEIFIPGDAFKMETSVDSHDINGTQLSFRGQPFNGPLLNNSLPSYARGSSFVQVLASKELSVFMNFFFCDCPKDRNQMYIDPQTYVNQRQ